MQYIEAIFFGLVLGLGVFCWTEWWKMYRKD